jgi:hypothetical protein
LFLFLEIIQSFKVFLQNTIAGSYKASGDDSFAGERVLGVAQLWQADQVDERV